MSVTLADIRVGAVVVTYQSASTIDACLTRLREAEGITAIRVVDNDSRDDTLDVVQRHALADPRVRFIANPDNPGFSVACNQGAGDIDAPWLAFVNPDCLVESDTFSRMLALVGGAPPTLLGADLVDEAGRRDPAARRRDPDFGAMLQGVFRNPAGKSQLAVAINDALPLQGVEAISGALMLLPRALFERIGGFDEGYRLHAEDLDLCRRVRAAGGVVAVANAVRVLHVRGVSSRSRPVFVEWHKHRGLWRYFSRFEAPRRGALVRGAVFLAIWLRFPLSVVRAALKR